MNALSWLMLASGIGAWVLAIRRTISRKRYMQLDRRLHRLTKKRIEQLLGDTQEHDREERRELLERKAIESAKLDVVCHNEAEHRKRVQEHYERVPIFCADCEEEIQPDQMEDAKRRKTGVHTGENGQLVTDWVYVCWDCQ